MLDSYLMIKDGDCSLSLAVRVGDYVPKKESYERFRRYVHGMEANKHYKALMKRIRVKEQIEDLQISEQEMQKVMARRGHRMIGYEGGSNLPPSKACAQR